MNRTILQALAVAFCFAAVAALDCYKCDLGLWTLPCITTTTTCEAGQQCYSGTGQAANFVNIRMKGCLNKADCNKTENINFPSSNSNGTVYKMNRVCCEGNLCNSAPAGLPGALQLALASIMAVLAANTLF